MYGEREKLLLTAEISVAPTSSRDILDELRNCATSVGRLVSSFKEASKRCCQLTEACAYPSLVEVFEVCLQGYFERYSALIKRLDRRKAVAHSWNIFQQSLTLNQTVGELLLQLEELDITLSMDFLECTKHFLGSGTKDHAFDQHHLFLLDSRGQDLLEKFFSEVQAGSNYPVVAPCLRIVSKLCEDVQATTFAILFHPVQDQLNGISESPVWSSTSAGSDSLEFDMPEFGFSPQEYITQIGQYLMTLPQHLEPYMTNENPALTRAFQERVFPYCSGVIEIGDNNPADFLLACTTRATCDAYQSVILKIQRLSVNSTKQLTTDIAYLGDILEDLGHPLSDGLASVLELLRFSTSEYWTKSAGMPQKLVSDIRQIRNLN